MSINLYESFTTLESVKYMTSTIDNSDFSVEHLIVVPDKFSLQMEKLLLSLLSKQAFFNVNVIGLTELANRILEGDKEEVLSSGESLLLTQKAIENVKKDLVVLNKNNINFCYQINKILMQLKSSLVAGDELNENASGLAGIKFHDLKLIYNEYESLRQKSDENTRLTIASQKVEKTKVFENTKVYFAGFDAFTAEGYTLLRALVIGAKEVSISIAKPKNIGNEYIYEKDIKEKVKKIAEECGQSVSVFEGNETFFPQKDAIISGVYSFSKTNCANNGYYALFSARSISEEVESVCKIIYDHITRGYKYSDFAIMLSDVKKYESEIENQFETFDIPYFIDTSICADQTILAKTLFCFFDVLNSHYSSQSLKVLFSDILLGKNEELIEKIDYYQIDNKTKYKKYIAKENAYDSVLVALEKCKNAKEFGEVVGEILNITQNSFENVVELLNEKAYLKEKNINIQAKEIVEEAIGLISEYEQDLSASEYEKKLKLLLSFKEVLTVPSYVDGVFVGDATQSSLLDSRVLFVVGAEALPIVSTDNSFLSDEELKMNYAEKPIEPTIRMINRRNRFKLFNLLTKAQEKLIVTYQACNSEGKRNELPSFVVSLNEIFGAESIKMGEQFDFVVCEGQRYSLGNRKAFERDCFNIFDEEAKSKLKIQDRKFVSPKQNETLLDGESVFFSDGKARVTQLEQYFSCPFKHFARYGLRIKEKEACQFEVKDVGNICHRGVELFVGKLIRNDFNLDEDVEKFVQDNFEKILKDENLFEKFEAIGEKESLEKYIKNHLISFISDVKKELSVTKFRPKYLEKKFSSMKVGKKELLLIGKADRIDVCGDYLRIIDYKTGSTGKILNELYFGDKLQLFLYLKNAEEELNKHGAGVFYFSAKFDYSKNGEEEKLLKGLVENDNEIIPLLDDGLDINRASSILPLHVLKNDSYSGSAVAKEKLSVYESYAKRVADKAVDEICEGFIEPKPDKDSCTWCPYLPICKYEKTDGERNKNKAGEFKGEE